MWIVAFSMVNVCCPYMENIVALWVSEWRFYGERQLLGGFVFSTMHGVSRLSFYVSSSKYLLLRLAVCARSDLACASCIFRNQDLFLLKTKWQPLLSWQSGSLPLIFGKKICAWPLFSRLFNHGENPLSQNSWVSPIPVFLPFFLLSPIFPSLKRKLIFHEYICSHVGVSGAIVLLCGLCMFLRENPNWCSSISLYALKVATDPMCDGEKRSHTCASCHSNLLRLPNMQLCVLSKIADHKVLKNFGGS